MIRATGRIGAIVIAAGTLLCVAAPSRANDVQADTTETSASAQPAEAEPGKPVALNKFTKRKRAAKVARVQKPRVRAKGYRRKAIEADAASNVVPMSDTDQAAIPESVSNANAQWPAPDTSIQSVTVTPPTTAAAAAVPSATPEVAISDQLNDADKAAAPSGDDAASQIASKMTAQLAQNPSQAAGVNVPTATTPAMSAMASADKPEVASNDNSAWGQSSLIGKIFIAFGGLLTIASAARMFMA